MSQEGKQSKKAPFVFLHLIFKHEYLCKNLKETIGTLSKIN